LRKTSDVPVSALYEASAAAVCWKGSSQNPHFDRRIMPNQNAKNIAPSLNRRKITLHGIAYVHAYLLTFLLPKLRDQFTLPKFVPFEIGFP